MLLILLLSDADRDILTAIYDANKRKLLYVANSYVGDRAEDLVHDLFIKLAEKYEHKMEELCDKEGYFFVTILKNQAIDLLRKEKHLEFCDLAEEDSIFVEPRQQPEARAITQDSVARLSSYLEELRPIYREVLEYRYLLEYTNSEIAQALHVSPSVVSTRLSRALQQLKARFEEEEG